MGASTTLYRVLRSGFDRIVDPLRKDDSIEHFTLSVPEAQTTTVDSVQGLHNRPPAVLICPECEANIYQMRPMDALDCGECWREYPESAFPELELQSMICPRCESGMQFGRRHPRMFDRPEWATCPNCQYHWDLDHWF